jgi:hypothetical protein
VESDGNPYPQLLAARFDSFCLGAARAAEGQPALVAVLLEKACALGCRHPGGFEAAREAARLYGEHFPDRADRAEAMLLPVHREAYAEAREPLAKRAAAEALAAALVRAARERARAGEVDAGLALLREASGAARSVRSALTDMVAEAQRELGALKRAAGQVARLKGLLERDPANEAARKGLVETLLVEFDNPAEAAKHLGGLADADLRRYVPAAAKGLGAAPAGACVEMGDWYRGVAQGASGDGARAAMLERARGYYARFLDLHEADDGERAKAEAALADVEDALDRIEGVTDPKLAHRVGLVGQINVKMDVYAVAFPPKGARAVAAVEKGLVVWNLEHGKLERAIPSAGRIEEVAISPRGRRAAAAYETEEGTALAQAWDLQTGRPLGRAVAKQGVMLGVGFDGETPVALRNIRDGHKHAIMHTWDLSSGEDRPTWDHDWAYLHRAAWSGDAKQVVLISGGGFDLYDLKRGERVGMRMPFGRFIDPFGVEVTGDGKFSLVAYSQVAGVVDGATGKTVAVCWPPGSTEENRPKDFVTATLSGNGRRVAAGRRSGEIVVYDGTTGKVLVQFDGHGETPAVSLSRDGKFLLSGSEKTLRLWGVP